MKDVTFVLVHLGPDPDKHVYSNIRYLRRNFSNPLVVITDNSKLITFCGREKADFFIYNRSEVTTALLHGFVGDTSFRDGFWFLTIERLIALAEFQEKNSISNLLHVESDVVLLKTFSLDSLKGTVNLWWTNVGPLYDCAALLYSPTPETASWLKANVVKMLHDFPSTTDMLVLRQIALDHPNKVTYFPSTLDTSNTPSVIFDPLQFGLYLFGSDPRNLYGFINRYVWWSEVGHSDMGIRYVTDMKGNIFLVYKSHKLQLLNLHNHSKNLLLFGRLQVLVIWFFVFTSRFGIFKKIPSFRFLRSNLNLLFSNFFNYRKYPLILRTTRNIFFK
jgi:hypothetical protein